jgi:hypothetical protein
MTYPEEEMADAGYALLWLLSREDLRLKWRLLIEAWKAWREETQK